MFLIISSLLDEDRLSVSVTVFRFSMFMAGVPIKSGNGKEGMDPVVWCIGVVKGRLIPDIVTGGQYMPRGF